MCSVPYARIRNVSLNGGPNVRLNAIHVRSGVQKPNSVAMGRDAVPQHAPRSRARATIRSITSSALRSVESTVTASGARMVCWASR